MGQIALVVVGVVDGFVVVAVVVGGFVVDVVVVHLVGKKQVFLLLMGLASKWPHNELDGCYSPPQTTHSSLVGPMRGQSQRRGGMGMQ